MPLPRRLARALRFPLFVVALLLFAVHALAQSGAPSISPAAESELLKVLSQGGAAAVLVVVLWSYRRDLAGLLKEERERTKVFADLIKESTAAHQKLADAVNNCPTNRGE